MREIKPHHKKCYLPKAGLNATATMAVEKANESIIIRPKKSYFANKAP